MQSCRCGPALRHQHAMSRQEPHLDSCCAVLPVTLLLPTHAVASSAVPCTEYSCESCKHYGMPCTDHSHESCDHHVVT